MISPPQALLMKKGSGWPLVYSKMPNFAILRCPLNSTHQVGHFSTIGFVLMLLINDQEYHPNVSN